jgi:Fe-S-cluster containining protein
MILEVRIYKIKPGLCDRFAEFFDAKALPAQEAMGMRILGQFRAVDDENTFVWLRAFEDEAERERQKTEFYEGPAWKGGLEEEAFSMIEDYSNVVLVEPTPASAIR